MARTKKPRRGRPSLDADEPSGMSPPWGIRLPQALRESLRRHAERIGESEATVARMAIREYLERHGGEA